MQITEKSKDKQFVIDAPEGAIVRPRKEKKPVPHIPTGYKVKCHNAECLGEHELDVAGPYFSPKLSYHCPIANTTINWPSHKGQASIRKRIVGGWNEKHLQELYTKMYDEHKKTKKVRKVACEKEPVPSPPPKPEPKKPRIDRGLLDALREKYG